MLYSLWYKPVLNDIFVALLSYAMTESVYLFMKQKYSKGRMDLHLYHKLIHISTGLIPMLWWPMFSGNKLGAVSAGVVSFLSIATKMKWGIGLKIDDLLRIRRRYKDRNSFKAAVGYLSTTTLVPIFYWKTPIAIATMCNLCAGDGVAGIAGRRYGSWKLQYNKSKSFAGSISMTIASFLASIGFMYYFCWLGYIEENPNTFIFGCLIVSIASALVESHPLSTKLDDNFTVPLASLLLATFLL